MSLLGHLIELRRRVTAVTLLFMAGPMVLFYEVSILAAWLIEHSRRRRSASSLD